MGYDLEKLDAAPLRLSDFFNPESNPALPEVMLLNTAALWCQACRIEHEELDTKLAEFGPRGLVIVSTLFQDAQSNPAQPVHLQLWAKQFESGSHSSSTRVSDGRICARRDGSPQPGDRPPHHEDPEEDHG
ncbi:MAG: hypothetical protein R3B89_33835 [Polyangiaceae bacterium]